MSEKRAPVQGYEPGIPWSLHLEAYAVYSKKWAPQPAMIDLEGRNCRGGFSVNELDEFVPGWRDRVDGVGAGINNPSEIPNSTCLPDGVKTPVPDLTDKQLIDATEAARVAVAVQIGGPEFEGFGPDDVNETSLAFRREFARAVLAALGVLPSAEGPKT